MECVRSNYVFICFCFCFYVMIMVVGTEGALAAISKPMTTGGIGIGINAVNVGQGRLSLVITNQLDLEVAVQIF